MARYSFESFKIDIRKMNASWEMPHAEYWQGSKLTDRVNGFHSILLEELEEYEPIRATTSKLIKTPKDRELALEVYTDLADWLVDLQVYAVSECFKFQYNYSSCANELEPDLAWGLSYKEYHITANPFALARVASVKHDLVSSLNHLHESYKHFRGSHNEYIYCLRKFSQELVDTCSDTMGCLGIDPGVVANIVMQSNFSKLDKDGKPIKDERGKTLKGPNYWKPEPRIKEYLNTLFV